MKICPECGGKIPEAETECPICGCLQEACFQESSADGAAFGESSEKRSAEQKCGCFHRFLLELFIFVFALFAAGVIVLATDFKGARTELRRMCMTDSGTGSEADTQYLRIAVKHYILIGLNWIDHGGTGEMSTVPREPQITPPESNVRKKVERPPLELPPDPPEVQEFKDPTTEYVIPQGSVPEQTPETAAPQPPQQPEGAAVP